MQPQVLINNLDIYELGLVTGLPTTSERKSLNEDKTTANQYELLVNNFDNSFSINHYKFLLDKNNWLYNSVIVKNQEDEIIWNGVITNIIRDHNDKRATIISKDIRFKFRNEIIEYESVDWETVANAFKNIADDIGFTEYNINSVLTSIATLTNNNCYVKVNFNKSDGITFQQAGEKLAEFANADFYLSKNKLYFTAWKELQSNPTVTITEDDFESMPVISESERDIINDFSIGYYGDNEIPATDSNNNNIGYKSRLKYGIKTLPEMRSNERAQIIYKDLTSALYIGEGYIKRSNLNYNTNPRPRTQISFTIKSDFKKYIALDSFIKITLSDENWNNKIFEIFSFEINEDDNLINVEALDT